MAYLPAILRVLALIAVGYALLCALLYLAQERLIFFPGARRLTRWGLIALLIAVFPANLHIGTSVTRSQRDG